jgi:hypothetical protein
VPDNRTRDVRIEVYSGGYYAWNGPLLCLVCASILAFYYILRISFLLYILLLLLVLLCVLLIVLLLVICLLCILLIIFLLYVVRLPVFLYSRFVLCV